MPYKWISPESAFVFRITHIDNMRWIVENGLHCRNGSQDRSFVTIGNRDIIERRDSRIVPVEPGGTLSDYIPFYFTPFSPMAYNIKTGHGVAAVPSHDIVILVASLRRLAGKPDVRFIYTDRHAGLETAEFHESLDQLHRIDWERLRTRDFRRDNDDPGKVERYQAEALVHDQLPIDLLKAIVCNRRQETTRMKALVRELGAAVEVSCSPRMYF